MSEKKSKYQQKLRRKYGHGRPDPRWMWWMERGTKLAGTTPEQQTEEQETAEA